MITYGKDNLTDFAATSYLQLNSCGYQDFASCANTVEVTTSYYMYKAVG